MDLNEIQALGNMITEAQKAAEDVEARKASSQPASQQAQLKNRVEETLGANFKAPKYEILYKQQVEASEVYGGFQQMTPSTMDSQFLEIRIYLPNEQLHNVDVELTEHTLTLFAKYHRLHLELPHDIYEKQSKAKWEKGVLKITVRRKDVE